MSNNCLKFKNCDPSLFIFAIRRPAHSLLNPMLTLINYV